MASETPQVQTSSNPTIYMEKYGHIVDLSNHVELSNWSIKFCFDVIGDIEFEKDRELQKLL